MNHKVDLSNNIKSQLIYPIPMIASPERKSSALQETSSNIMNQSPEKPVVLEPGSRKRVAVSPMSAVNQPVRRKLDQDHILENNQDDVFVEVELNYRNWLLEKQLDHAKQVQEFLILEREYSTLQREYSTLE